MRMRHIAICDLPRCTIFSHIISQTARFSEKSYWTQTVCLEFLYSFVWNTSHYRKNWARYDQKYISVCMWSAFILVRFQQNLIFSTDFLKATKYKISRKSVTWEPRAPHGRTDRHDAMMLIDTLRSPAAPPPFPKNIFLTARIGIVFPRLRTVALTHF